VEKFEDIALRIEETYKKLQEVINMIGSLKDIAEDIQKATDNIKRIYSETLKADKLSEVQKDNKKAFEAMAADVKKIDETLESISVLRIQAQDSIKMYGQRISNYEDSVRKNKELAQKIDVKLTTIVDALEKQRKVNERDYGRVVKLVEATVEIEKYDELIRLQKENNTLLQKLLSRSHKE
jgi:hypothetical protein